FIGVFSYVLVLTGAKENAIVIVSVLFTPVALGFKNLEKKIDTAANEYENTAAATENKTGEGEKSVE
uniref:hypothetical protein n=1 Tax=Ruminococcus flavefaciens TaxID=1265 RepID=UPI00056009FE